MAATDDSISPAMPDMSEAAAWMRSVSTVNMVSPEGFRSEGLGPHADARTAPPPDLPVVHRPTSVSGDDHLDRPADLAPPRHRLRAPHQRHVARRAARVR